MNSTGGWAPFKVSPCQISLGLRTFKTFTSEKYGGWESSTHCKYKKRLQIKKTTSSIWQHARCKCSQHNQKKKRAANRKQRLQIKKTTFINLTTHTLLMLTTQPKKKRAANEMYLVVLWAFAVCFSICLCCGHLHHLLSNWWRCFFICWCFFYLHVFSEVAVRWALSATVEKAALNQHELKSINKKTMTVIHSLFSNHAAVAA